MRIITATIIAAVCAMTTAASAERPETVYVCYQVSHAVASPRTLRLAAEALYECAIDDECLDNAQTSCRQVRRGQSYESYDRTGFWAVFDGDCVGKYKHSADTGDALYAVTTASDDWRYRTVEEGRYARIGFRDGAQGCLAVFASEVSSSLRVHNPDEV